MLGTGPFDTGPVKVSAAHHYRGDLLWAWDVLGCFGYQQH